MASAPSDDATALLIDLGEALHGAAIPADIAEPRLRAVASRLGIDADFFTLQSFLATELRGGGRGRVEIRRMSFDTHWNLTRTTALVELTEELGEGKLDLVKGRAALDRIRHQPARFPAALVGAGYGVYGAVVAARVGGGWREMAPALVIGLVAGLVHQGTTKSNEVNLQKSFLGAMLGSLTAIVLAFLLPPFDFGRALFGGMVMLVPAMVVTIGIHELANEALESGTIRLAYGLVRFALMAAGIAGAFVIARVIGAWPAYATAHALPDAVVLGLVALGGLALVPILQGRPRDVFWIVLAAVLAHGTHMLTKVFVGPHGAPAVAAFVLGVAAYLQARIPGHVPFTMIVPGLLQLAPGFIGTEATIGLLREGGLGAGGGATFFNVILVAIQLGIGLLVAGLLFRKQRITLPATTTKHA